MSETIQSISNGTYTIGNTSATNFIAGNGIKIDSPSAGTVRIGNDETVLWSGTSANSFTLLEPSMHFERLGIKLRSYQSPDYYAYCECLPNSAAFHFEFVNQVPKADLPCQYAGFRYSTTDDLTYNFVAGQRLCFGTGTYTNTANNLTGSNIKDAGYPVVIIGINRISGGNA